MNPTATHTDQALRQYVETALWSSLVQDGEHEGEALDDHYGPEDIARQALEDMRVDVAAFLEEAADLMASVDMPVEQAAHDFWLTRNRHGAGFWDRGLGATGERLSNMAHAYGPSDLYVGDDGKLWVS